MMILLSGLLRIRVPYPRKYLREEHLTSRKIYRNISRHVFVRQGHNRGHPLPHYLGPYLIVHKVPKVFGICIVGKDDNVALKRLKPAHLAA